MVTVSRLMTDSRRSSGTTSHYLGEDGCGSVAVSSQGFVQLVQSLHHRSLVLVLPQRPVPDQPAVVIHRPAEAPGGARTHLLLHLLPGFDGVTLEMNTTRRLVQLVCLQQEHESYR